MELFFTFCLGALVGTLVLYLLQKMRLATVRQLSKEIIRQAEIEALKLRETGASVLKAAEQKNQIAFIKQENDLRRKEEKCEQKTQELNQKLQEQRRKEEQQIRLYDETEKKQLQIEAKLSQIAQLSKEEAKRELIEKERAFVEKESQSLFLQKLQALDTRLEEEAQKKIIATLERISSKQDPVSPLLYVDLKNEESKSRIIGRDGRNIKAFEQYSGVTLIIDDSPFVIGISSFDPKRRHVAKRALIELMEDGRIHPARIEETLLRAEENLDTELLKLAESSAESALVFNLHPEILRLLGKLSLRSSLGQNVLDHSLEVSQIMGILAAELKLNEQKARRIGLLHDIGKALPADMGLTHAIAGMQFAAKFGEKEDVTNGIGCHHDEIEAKTKESALCKIADTLSAKRTGARREPLEKHMQKIQSLEELALQFSGVEKAYALQAGRELRVFVKPESIDDLKAVLLAKNIAKKIEESASFPGKVQVTIIREKKIIEFAS